MNEILIFLIFTFVFCTIVYIKGIIDRERILRNETEKELIATRKTLKNLCEACINENNSINARITYQAYFGGPVNLTGDGFIDGEE